MSTISQTIEERGITEVLHFTPSTGLTGVLAKRALLARDLLLRDDALEYVRATNTPRNMDPAWKGHVNLSISRINRQLFRYSERIHPTHKWRILSFSPEILTHPDVSFVTTNNIYPAARRAKGVEGLNALFAPSVAGRYDVAFTRLDEMESFHPTDLQAEVLYPLSISTQYLNAIYVREPEEIDSVRAKFAQIGHEEVHVAAEPYRFE